MADSPDAERSTVTAREHPILQLGIPGSTPLTWAFAPADRLPTGSFDSSESLSTTDSFPLNNTIRAAANPMSAISALRTNMLSLLKGLFTVAKHSQV